MGSTKGLAAVVSRVGAPVVPARAADEWQVIVRNEELTAMSGWGQAPTETAPSPASPR
jgi:hypothetical protein